MRVAFKKKLKKRSMATVWGMMASGMLFRNRGNVFLQLRSGDVEDGGVWGIPGGALKGTEGYYESEDLPRPVLNQQALLQLWNSAVDEVYEEVGYDINFDDQRFFGSQKVVNWKDNFPYVTFIVDVSDKEAKLLEEAVAHEDFEWESAGHQWHGLNDLPETIHPGVQYALEEMELPTKMDIKDAVVAKMTHSIVQNAESRWTQNQVYDDGENVYDIELLEKVTENNDVAEVYVSKYASQLFDKGVWQEGDKPLSPMMVMGNPTFDDNHMEHMARIRTANVDKPILIRFSNQVVVDGYHRLSRAFLEGKGRIKARFVQEEQMSDAIFKS